jgi:hypothetical protein
MKKTKFQCNKIIAQSVIKKLNLTCTFCEQHMGLHFTHLLARRTLHSRFRTLTPLPPPHQPAPAPCTLLTP